MKVKEIAQKSTLYSNFIFIQPFKTSKVVYVKTLLYLHLKQILNGLNLYTLIGIILILPSIWFISSATYSKYYLRHKIVLLLNENEHELSTSAQNIKKILRQSINIGFGESVFLEFLVIKHQCDKCKSTITLPATAYNEIKICPTCKNYKEKIFEVLSKTLNSSDLLKHKSYIDNHSNQITVSGVKMLPDIINLNTIKKFVNKMKINEQNSYVFGFFLFFSSTIFFIVSYFFNIKNSNFKLRKFKLKNDCVLSNGISVKNDTFVELFPNGMFKKYISSKDYKTNDNTIIQKGKEVEVYKNGNFKRYTLNNNHKIVLGFVLKKDTEITLFNNGNLKRYILAKDFNISDKLIIKSNSEVEHYEGADENLFTLEIDKRKRNKRNSTDKIFSQAEFLQKGNFKRFTIAKNYELSNKLVLKEGTEIELFENGNIKKCTFVDSSKILHASKIQQEHPITFFANGNIHFYFTENEFEGTENDEIVGTKYIVKAGCKIENYNEDNNLI